MQAYVLPRVRAAAPALFRQMGTNAPVAEAASGKAIYASHDYYKFGEGASKDFGFLKHLTIGLTAGVALGFIWKVGAKGCWRVCGAGHETQGTVGAAAGLVGTTPGPGAQQHVAAGDGGAGGFRAWPAYPRRACGLDKGLAAPADAATFQHINPPSCTCTPAHADGATQTWHWNEKRYIAQWYADMAKKEAREEAERSAALQEKYKALEEELLS